MLLGEIHIEHILYHSDAGCYNRTPPQVLAEAQIHKHKMPQFRLYMEMTQLKTHLRLWRLISTVNEVSEVDTHTPTHSCSYVINHR